MATDFERLRAMTDDDIDCSDIPPLEDLLEDSEGLMTTPDTELTFLSLNRKALDYFKNSGKGYLDRLNTVMNSLLINYVNEQQKAEGVM